MQTRDHELLASIQSRTLDTLRDAMGHETRSAILLDFPRHRNAGDALIYAGQREYLAKLKIERPFTVDVNRFDFQRMAPALDGSVVLFNGGGNLGDIWPEYQDFRERVIPLLRGTKVVILPQSTWFDNHSNAERANRVFGEHGDVTILLREHESLERAQTYFPDAKLMFCPDMAFGNSPSPRSFPARQPLTFLSRQDKEKTRPAEGNRLHAGLSEASVDWEPGMSRANRTRWAALKVPGIIYKRVPATRKYLEGSLFRSQEAMCDLNLSSARAILSRGETLITDRLHAHVLAVLMGIPNIVLDNNYGKISSVFNEYSGQFSSANMANSIESALELANQMRG